MPNCRDAGARSRARARAISAMRSVGAGARDRKLPLVGQDNDNQADATRGASGVPKVKLHVAARAGPSRDTGGWGEEREAAE